MNEKAKIAVLNHLGTVHAKFVIAPKIEESISSLSDKDAGTIDMWLLSWLEELDNDITCLCRKINCKVRLINGA